MKICFTGDVFLGGDLLNESCLNTVDVRVFSESHKRIINLEQPISDSSFVENKSTLYTGSSGIKQLQDLRINAVNMAHNHIQDKGLEAIDETACHLDSSGIDHFGAGKNIKLAGEPYWLSDDIAVLGYCEFDKSYLNKIVVADAKNPGVNPLRLEKIKSDLDQLQTGKKAILFFHWGMEHVWMPPCHDISLAKRLLEDERVITIIGMHCHRIQGVIEHKGKKAYMSLGNFIFPNFYIHPPTQLFNPSEEEKKSIRYTTKQYHSVYEPTYKKWRWVNRVSLVLEFCTKTMEINHTFVVQDDDRTRVTELTGVGLNFYRLFIKILGALYKLPTPVYSVLWKLHVIQAMLAWRMQIRWFHLKQLGLKKFLGKLLSYIKKNLK